MIKMIKNDYKWKKWAKTKQMIKNEKNDKIIRKNIKNNKKMIKNEQQMIKNEKNINNKWNKMSKNA